MRCREIKGGGGGRNDESKFILVNTFKMGRFQFLKNFWNQWKQTNSILPISTGFESFRCNEKNHACAKYCHSQILPVHLSQLKMGIFKFWKKFWNQGKQTNSILPISTGFENFRCNKKIMRAQKCMFDTYMLGCWV